MKYTYINHEVLAASKEKPYMVWVRAIGIDKNGNEMIFTKRFKDPVLRDHQDKDIKSDVKEWISRVDV